MAYRIEEKDIVIDGWEKGIAPDPYSGISDIRNANIISIPQEASVVFSTTASQFGSFTATIASASAGDDTCTYSGATGTPITGMAVVFAGASLPTGITAGTQSATADTNVYYIGNVNTSAQTFKVYTDVDLGTLVDITGTGTGTVATINMGIPTSETLSKSGGVVYEYYQVDSNGRAWVAMSSYWRYLKNITHTYGKGNGLVWYSGQTPAAKGYLFVFENSKIDYMNVDTRAWVYAWQTLNTGNGVENPHDARVCSDDVVYYTDDTFVGSFFQKSVATPFDPNNAATYTFSSQALRLPSNEKAQCLAELGVPLLVGGATNAIYPWDRTSTSFTYPILLPETDIKKMVTVNTNTYIFAGNRGRIYRTNGSQVQLYKKIPDHISGTVEPYFTWYAAGFLKNQLFFGVRATTNSSGAVPVGYGGLWAIDTDTDSLRLVNKLSFGTYTGWATTFQPILSAASGGSFYVGWNSGSSTYGIDITSSDPYSNYETTIDTDMIPVGTFYKQRTFSQIEFKLAKALVTGEGISIYYRTNSTDDFTLIWTNTTAGTISDARPVSFQKSQWLQFRIAMKSTATTPTYTRLRELRIR